MEMHPHPVWSPPAPGDGRYNEYRNTGTPRTNPSGGNRTYSRAPAPAGPPWQGPNPTPEKQRSFFASTKGVITLVATLVGIVAAVVSIMTALASRPAPYLQADWAQAANTRCDSLRAELSSSFRTIDENMQRYGEAADYENVAREAESAADVWQKFIGDLQTIRLPEDGRAQIESLFTLANGLDQNYYQLADYIRSMDASDPTAEPLRSNLLATMDEIDQQHSKVANTFNDLGAVRCGFVPR